MATNHYSLKHLRSIAVIGGTFDPIHFGHLAAAEAVAKFVNPQKVLFVPSGQPPHKTGMPVSPAEHRYNMVQIATAANPLFDVSRIEIERNGPSFTLDTIKAIIDECRPGAEITFVTGADAIMEILTWHRAAELLTLCKFVAVTRPGVDRVKKHVKMLEKDYSARIKRLEVPGLNISGSDIRERFKTGRPVRYLLPHQVEAYAREHHLYGTKTLSFKRCEALIKARLSSKRYEHTMGVVDAAAKLAAHYNTDVNKARLAALLHDCAKEYSEDKKRELCKQWGIRLDKVLIQQINLTHSFLSAESARRDFGVTDREVLQAIRYHTMGNANMSPLDKIIMTADFIEETREPYEGLQEMRELAFKDIDAALRIGIANTIKFNEEKGRPVHRASRAALEELKNERKF
jgi:nicotinate-nucleotide adenylyltransferase